jgi:hypothetical protein
VQDHPKHAFAIPTVDSDQANALWRRYQAIATRQVESRIAKQIQLSATNPDKLRAPYDKRRHGGNYSTQTGEAEYDFPNQAVGEVRFPMRRLEGDPQQYGWYVQPREGRARDSRSVTVQDTRGYGLCGGSSQEETEREGSA